MRISFRLRQLLGKEADRRGVIADMEKETGVERHTISALMNNQTTSVSLEILSKVCEYLINVHHIPAERLPGALLGRDPEEFWDLMGSCERIEFCLGTRRAKEWPGSEYVMSTDSLLQGLLLSHISQAKYGPGANATQRIKPPQADGDAGEVPDQQADATDSQTPLGMRFFSEFHLVPAPGRDASPNAPGKSWEEATARAKEVYLGIRNYTERRALIALGSIKVNPVVELMLADAFAGVAFEAPEGVETGRQRRCPIFFRCRDSDPLPPSFCGGTELAARVNSLEMGIYHEDAEGKWTCCPWNEKDHDVAFFWYANKCTSGLVEMACGGFSARSTRLLTENLEQIVPDLESPLYDAEKLRLGLYLIKFTRKLVRRSGPGKGRRRDWDFEIVPVAKRAIERRLS